MLYLEQKTNVVFPIPDAYNVSIKTQINGQFDLFFTVPLKSTFADELQRDVIVWSDDPVYNDIRFRIYEIRNGLTTKTVSCHLKTYDLRFSVVKPFTATSLQDAVTKINANMTNGMGYTFSTSVVDNRAFTFAKPMSAWALIGEMQKIYDFEVDLWKNPVTFYSVLPSPTLAFTIKYGDNLVGYDVQFDDSKVYTSVLPYWQKSGSSIVYGSVIDAPSISWSPYKRILPVDFTQAFEKQPTAAQLNAAAASYISANKIGEPGPASVKANNTIAQDTLMEQARLGCGVAIYGPDNNYYFQRIVATDYDPIAKRFRSFDLGETRKTLEGIVRENSVSVDELDNNRFSAAPVILARSTSTSPTEISMTEGYITENFHSFILTVRNSIRVIATTTIQRAEIPDTTTSQYSDNNANNFKNYGSVAYFDGNAAAWVKINLATWKCKLMTTSNYEAVLYGMR